MSNLELEGKILLIRSILLTKGLIVSHLKLTSIEVKCALESLLQKQFLMVDKFLQCGKRKIQAYLKFVPKDIGNRADVYLLQRRLLDLNVDVHTYIDSLKTIKYATISLRPSNILMKKLNEDPYSRLEINLTLKRKGLYWFARRQAPWIFLYCLF